MKYSNLDEYMRETNCHLIIDELNKMIYFDDGEWVVCERTNSTSKWIALDRFLDAVPSALEEALRFIDGHPTA